MNIHLERADKHNNAVRLDYLLLLQFWLEVWQKHVWVKLSFSTLSVATG